MVKKGWYGERHAHGLCARGIRVRPQKMMAEGKAKSIPVPYSDKSFVGVDEFSIKGYESVGRFQGAVQRIVNRVFDKYFWHDTPQDLRNTRSGEIEELTLKEAFVSDDVWEIPTWHSNLRIGQFRATLNESYGEGEHGGRAVGGFDFWFEPDSKEIVWSEEKYYIDEVPLSYGKGEGQIYVFMGEYVDE